MARVAGGDSGTIVWIVKAAIDGVLGVVLGLALIPVASGIIAPVLRAVGLGGEAAH